jgi:sugar phosphate isomerase/epimerase
MDAKGGLMTRWGCTTATFGGRLPDKLRAMQQAGFTATELFPRDLFEDPRGPDYCMDLVRDSGLKISAYQALRDYEGMPVAHRDHVLGIAAQMMDQMAWLGAEVLVLCANIQPDASADRPRCVADLLLLAELAHSRGLRVAYEPIGWARHHSDYRSAWSLVREVDHPCLGLALDSLHVAATGLPLDAIALIDPGKVFLVQLCDWPQTRLPPFEVARNYRLFPGEGVGPVQEFFAQFQRMGYSGWYSVEIMNAYYQHEDPLQVARRAMETTCRMAGMTPRIG